MGVNRDFKDLFKLFNAEGVEYLLVGAHAVIFYSEPRYTKDLDIWVNPSPENAENTWRALEKFGAPLEGVNRSDFTDTELIYQIGVEPNRIDVIMGLPGLTFEAAYRNSAESTYGGIPIRVIAKSDLVAAKKATGRKQDILDVERLEDSD